MNIRTVASRRRRRRHLLGGMAALILAILILSTTLFFMLHSNEEAIDIHTLCPVSGPVGHVILLVDRTDPLNFTQKQAFLQYLTELAKKRIKAGELLSVFVLGEDFTAQTTPLFERCHPGDGTGKNMWTANPEKMRRVFDTQFLSPVVALVDTLQTKVPASYSPIMEMIQLVAINGFRTKNSAGPKQLYIISDMLQNTPVYSHYQGSLDFPVLEKTPFFTRVKTDLHGVTVELAYLLTNPTRQTRRHAKFWEDYFNALGATLVSVRVLEG